MNKTTRLQVTPWILITATLCAFLLAGFIYIYFLQTSSLSRREFAFAALLWIALVPLLYPLFSRFLLPRLAEYSRRGRLVWLLICGMVGILTVLVTFQPAYAYFLLSQRTFEVSIPEGNKNRSITLEWANTSLGDISFDQFQWEGEWEQTENGLTHNGSMHASLVWTGLTGDAAQLVFSKSIVTAPISISWDGQIETIDLSQGESQNIIVSRSFKPDIISRGIIYFLTWFISTFLFLVITLFFARLQLKAARSVKQKNGYWLLYTLPLIAVWGVVLLTFFPGIISPDAINQWRQIQTGHFNDALPVVHTLIVLMITRVWFSPAAVIITQILFLCLTIAWGIHILDERGLPRWAAWTLAMLFAFSPVNSRMVITLWKDIPYSTCLLLFSLMVLKVVFSRGEWLEKKASWFWFGLVGLGISSFRLNGLPVPLFTLIILAIIYRRHWKPIIGALTFFLGLFVLIQGPVYNQLKVDRKEGFKQLIFLHHISAHVVAGGPLTPEEVEMTNRILPFEEWTYDCCTNIRVWRAESYSEKRFAEEAGTIFKLFTSLAVKEPVVEGNHMVCVSSLIWELPSRCKLNREAPPEGETVLVSANTLGLKEESLLPALVIPLTYLQWWVNRPPQDILFYTPALFLYLGIYCTALFAFRSRSANRFLFILPAGIQSGVMLLINVSRDFRYQYGVYLIGLFSLGLLILALTIPQDQHKDLNNSESTNEKTND